MTEHSISEIMMKHHYNIDKVLNIFTKELRDKKTVNTSTFNKFKWELEKHFFLEEKAIFQLHYSNNQQTNTITSKLKAEHDDIIRQMELIEKNLIQNKSVEFDKLRKKIIEHKSFENLKFYPLLDNELEDDRKEIIIQRLSNPF